MEKMKVRINNVDDFKFFFELFLLLLFVLRHNLPITFLLTRDYRNPTVTKTFRYFTADKVLVTFFM